MSSPILLVEGVEVVYHRAAIAVQGVTFKVEPGQLVALLGNNGAGKTTTLRAVSGFLGSDDAEVTAGSVTYQGERIERLAPYEIVRRGVVLVPEREKIFQTLTVEENLATAGRRARLDEVYRFFPILAERRKQVAGYLSGGQRQMLALGQALLCEPRLLLVDELSLGLSPLVAQELFRALRQMRDELGLTILLVEQNAAAALAIADFGYVMEQGRIVYEAEGGRLGEHADIREFYLGVAGEGATRSYRDVKQYRRKRRWHG